MAGVAEPDELALHAPVPPRGILDCDADHEFRIAAAVDGRPGCRRLV
jgi:hypothetical protein